MKLRDYQIRLSKDTESLLERKKIAVLAMEVRTGKTLTALNACKNYKSVLFITKLKAIESVKKDYNNFGFSFDLTVINRESLHKIERNDFDVLIIDEVHGYSSYPKPSMYFKEVKKKFGHLPMIMLSGTLTPESYSQFYHIFQLSNHSPFKQYINFYKWANEFVDITEKQLGYAKVKDYSKARKKDFWHLIRHYILTFTQSEAGFTTNVNEMTLEVEMKPITYQIIQKLKKDNIVRNKNNDVILADTGVKLQQKIHQLCSGTVKFEDGTSRTIDDSKARYISERFNGYKIAVFYNFVQELEMLKSVIGQNLTTDLNEFNTTDKWIALQIVSGREGVSLAKADYMVMLNIQFSAVSYFQSRDRMTTMDRKENTIFWLFSKGGIEEKIYQTVKKKKDFTNSIFKRECL